MLENYFHYCLNHPNRMTPFRALSLYPSAYAFLLRFLLLLVATHGEMKKRKISILIIVFCLLRGTAQL